MCACVTFVYVHIYITNIYNTHIHIYIMYKIYITYVYLIYYMSIQLTGRLSRTMLQFESKGRQLENSLSLGEACLFVLFRCSVYIHIHIQLSGSLSLWNLI